VRLLHYHFYVRIWAPGRYFGLAAMLCNTK
jgi:hypothetical protein